MLYTALNTAMIDNRLARAERLFWTTLNNAQGVAAVGCILAETIFDLTVSRIDRGMDDWQAWSDATFADVQPYLESVLTNLAYLVAYALGALYGFCRQSLRITWQAWLSTAEQRATLAQLLIPDYATIRTVLYAACGVVKEVLLAVYDAAMWVTPRVARWTAKAIGAALCVNW